ncbi:MAG: hypothetical protein U5O39_10360 [Gammaproteobacteria bacterium]|nr:hypothetical protein [Gammaproteobacteria bacterium]
MSNTIEDAIERDWQRIRATGTWWTGDERIAIAREWRAAQAGESPGPSLLPDVAVEAIQTIATRANTIGSPWIESCHERGLDPLPMVELMALVARMSAIDTYDIGVRDQLAPLPEPLDGEPPPGTAPQNARINAGWLPTVGRAGAPVCMSAVPAEHEAWEDLHSHLYLSIAEMRELDLTKDLHRAQMELLAARTSHYNDCFY